MALGTAALAAMASPRRREILRVIWTEERSAGDIHRSLPDVTFGAISLHLKAMREAGLVEIRPHAQQRFYRARREAFGDVGRELERMWGDALARLKVQAELDSARRGPRGKRGRSARRTRTARSQKRTRS